MTMKHLLRLALILSLGLGGCSPVMGQHLTKMSGYGYEMQGLSVDSMFFVPVRDTGFTGSYKRAGALVFRTIGTDRTLYAYDGIKWINVTASLSKGLDSMVISGDSLIAYLTNGSQVVTKLPLYGVKSSNGTVSIIGNAKVWGDSLDLSASGGSSGGLTRDSAKYPVWADTGIVVEGGANTQFIDTVKIKARYYDALWNAASLLGVPIDTSALSDRDVLTYFGGVWTNMPVNTQVIDTSSLSNRINAKLNIVDTTGHWQPLGNYAPPIVAGTGITYNSTTGTVSAKISAAGGNALTTDGGGGMYVPQPVAGTDTTVKGVIYNPTVDDTIRLTTNTLDTIKARMHLNTAIDSGVFISATNQMHLYRFNGDSIVMTILGGAVTSVNGLTGNVQLNLSILGRVISLTDGSSVTIPHDSLNLSGNNLSIKGSNTLDIGVPIKAIVSDTADAIRAGIHNLSNYNLVQDSTARIYSTNKGALYIQDTAGTNPDTRFMLTPDSIVQTLTGGYKTTYTLKDNLINMDVYDRTGGELEARAQVNRSGLYLYTGVGGRDASTQTLILGAGGTIQAVSFRNNAAQDSVVTGDTTGLLHFKYMPSADSIMLRNDLQDSLAGKLIFDTTTNSLPLHKIHSTYGITVTGGDSTVLTQDVNIVPDTTSSSGLASKTWVQNQGYGSGGGSGTDTVHQVKAPLTISRSGNVVTYGADTASSHTTALVTQNQLSQHNSFDTTKFNAPTTDGKILFSGDGKMFHNGYFSLNPDSIWGAYPLGDSVSLPNTNLGNSDLSLSDAARWVNLNDGGLYITDSSNYTSPNSDYIANFTKDGFNVHKGKLTVVNSVAGTPGTDSIWVKHTGGDFRVISGGYYATPSQVVDSITAHTVVSINSNIANTNLVQDSSFRSLDLNGGILRVFDNNRTYGDPVANISRSNVAFTIEDDGANQSAGVSLLYPASPTIQESSITSTGGRLTRTLDSSGWLWNTDIGDVARLRPSGEFDIGTSVIYQNGVITSSFSNGAAFEASGQGLSLVRYGGVGGAWKVDSLGTVTIPKYAGAATSGKVATFDDDGNMETLSIASISSSAPNIITSTTDSTWTLSSTDNIIIIKPGSVWHEEITLPPTPSQNQEIKIYWITSQSSVSTNIIPGTGKTFYASDGSDYSGGETFVGNTFKFFDLKYDTATSTWYMLMHTSTN